MTNSTPDTSFLFDRMLFALRPGGAPKRISPPYVTPASIKADLPVRPRVERAFSEHDDAERWDGLS